MQDVEVIESAQAAASALDPVRARLLDTEEVRAFASGRRPFEDDEGRE